MVAMGNETEGREPMTRARLILRQVDRLLRAAVVSDEEDGAGLENAAGFECSVGRVGATGAWRLTALGVLNGLLVRRDRTLLLEYDETTGELVDARVVWGGFRRDRGDAAFGSGVEALPDVVRWSARM